MVFVDEADTMFGSIDSEQETERRLTGKFQAMMSDPVLRGRVIWFLMTARVHKLSPDIRRPGRMDLIIPILDPEDSDHTEFMRWVFGQELVENNYNRLADYTKGISSASFALIRDRIKAKKCETIDEVEFVLNDLVEPDIRDTRRYQTLQAKINCTRRSLLVHPSLSRREFENQREDWQKEIQVLEAKGIS